MEIGGNIIELKSLQKSFKNLHVLKGIDLNIKKGSIFALLGSNGAGKTTIVNILSTLMTFDSGTVQICGCDLKKDTKKIRSCISLTGQFVAVDEAMSGKENLMMIASLRHLKNKKEQVKSLLMYFQLEDAANRRVETYSGGMRRRLDIAMSMLGNPEVVFLDEPTTGLDPQARLAMWKIVKLFAQNGTTIFLTTQYLEEAEQLADEIAILNGGKIVAKGTPHELKKRLPQGILEVSFYHEEEQRKAKAIFGEYQIDEDDDAMTLTIHSNGSLEDMSRILSKLQKEEIEVASFTQKLPTLEDVFLNLIKEEGGDVHEQ